MQVARVIDTIKRSLGDIAVEPLQDCSPEGILVESDSIKATCKLLYEHEDFYFDMLSCITGIDNGPEVNSMEVIYNLYSITYERSLVIKVILGRTTPEVDSVESIWRTANWHEREAYDLFGIRFKGHSDLRRILLPADWEGYPLRKDYEHQEYYRGIKVEY